MKREKLGMPGIVGRKVVMLTRLAFSLRGFEKQQTRCTDVFVIFMRGSHRKRARHRVIFSCMENARKRRGVNLDELQARGRYDAELLVAVKTNKRNLLSGTGNLEPGGWSVPIMYSFRVKKRKLDVRDARLDAFI